jgi:hypothetical protein
MSINPIPAGFHTLVPNIIVKNVDAAVSFYRRAFGAEEILRLSMPAGKVVHCELNLGNSRLNLGESMEGWPEHTLACPDFCRGLGCGFRAGRECRCRSVELHDRYVFRFTGRARPRSIR